MSEVWNHFYMAPNGLSVNCNHCGKFMKRSDSSTKSMWGHLKAFHADLVGEETFRLKRTRRMRGNGGGGGTASKKKGKKATKKGGAQKAAVEQQRLAAAEASAGSSSSASSSAGEEEEERQSVFSGTASSRGTSPSDGQREEEEAVESPKHVKGEPAMEKAAASPLPSAGLSIQTLLELGVAELEKSEEKVEKEEKQANEEEKQQANEKKQKEKKQEEEKRANEEKQEKEKKQANEVKQANEEKQDKEEEKKPKGEEPTVKTPTQPYVKRKRQQPTSDGGSSQNQLSQEHQQPTELLEQPVQPVMAAQKEEEVGAVLPAVGSSPAPPSVQPAKKSSQSPSPNAALLANQAQANIHIPHSGAQSAFSKYSTAALLQQGGQEGGKKSPAHGEEAPKSRQNNHNQHQSMPRPAYGLEAMTGLNAQQLSMLGLADPQLLAQLETAAAMSQLVHLQQQQQQTEKSIAVVPVQQQQPKPVQAQSQAHQQQQSQNERAMNELLALYAASAAAASALQQHQQDGLKAKAAGQQQQQQMAQQQAAAAAWLYNWEWLAAAQRMGGGTTAGTFGGGNNNLMGAAGNNGMQQQAKGQAQQQAQLAAMSAALGLSLNGTNGATNLALTNGQPKPKNGQQQQQAVQLQTADTMLARAAMSQLLIQAQQQQHVKPANQPSMAQAKAEPTGNNQQSQAQKRKSPTMTTTSREECAAANSLLVLADTAASTASVERRMQQQQQREETGASPPKQVRKEPAAAVQQQQQLAQVGEREKALVESLVLYGMHRIAMELQLSYSVHANKGKAEYAFYCASNGGSNANIHRMVTLTESADQILHIREYANGTVVAEECWPKSAEPYNLLSSLRDKCQRRLCSAQ